MNSLHGLIAMCGNSFATIGDMNLEATGSSYNSPIFGVSLNYGWNMLLIKNYGLPLSFLLSELLILLGEISLVLIDFCLEPILFGFFSLFFILSKKASNFTLEALYFISIGY